MKKAVYIATIVITMRNKKEVKKIRKELYPIILNEKQEIPKEELKSQLRRLLKNDVKFKNFDNWMYSYEIIDYKFSTNIYEANKVKKDLEDVS
jgi:hypothetical protein